MAALSVEEIPADAKALLEEPEDAYYARIFAEYIAAKKSLGDPVDHITRDAFVARLKSSEQELGRKHGKPMRYKIEVRARRSCSSPCRSPDARGAGARERREARRRPRLGGAPRRAAQCSTASGPSCSSTRPDEGSRRSAITSVSSQPSAIAGDEVVTIHCTLGSAARRRAASDRWRCTGCCASMSSISTTPSARRGSPLGCADASAPERERAERDGVPRAPPEIVEVDAMAVRALEDRLEPERIDAGVRHAVALEQRLEHLLERAIERAEPLCLGARPGVREHLRPALPAVARDRRRDRDEREHLLRLAGEVGARRVVEARGRAHVVAEDAALGRRQHDRAAGEPARPRERDEDEAPSAARRSNSDCSLRRKIAASSGSSRRAFGLVTRSGCARAGSSVPSIQSATTSGCAPSSPRGLGCATAYPGRVDAIADRIEVLPTPSPPKRTTSRRGAPAASSSESERSSNGPTWTRRTRESSTAREATTAQRAWNAAIGVARSEVGARRRAAASDRRRRGERLRRAVACRACARRPRALGGARGRRSLDSSSGVVTVLRKLPPPDFRYVWLHPEPGSTGALAAAGTAGLAGASAAVWSAGSYALSLGLIAMGSALGLLALVRADHRPPIQRGAREVTMAVVPWGSSSTRTRSRGCCGGPPSSG